MRPRLISAEAKVTQTRAALIDTARELQLRLQPRTLARDAWESAKVKGADIAEDAVDAVKRRPVATGGIVAALAMFLARDPIKDGVRNIYDAMTSKEERKTAPARPPATPRKARAARTPRKTEKE
jgi:hypothetical protein